jgi:hypothetical protein
MYVDETGNSDLASSEDPNHRYLSLTGVILSFEYVDNTLHPELEKLKTKYFHSHPDDPIVLHRAEMVNKKGPFTILHDKRSEEAFNKELLQMLEKWEYRVITVLIDKKEHKDKYSTWRYDPYHYCLAVLLERYLLFLESCGKTGDVLAESRGGKEDRRLKESFARLYKEGTEYIDADRIRSSLTSSQLKIKSKANNIAGLQLADILAHPSRREMLKEEGVIPTNDRIQVFGDQIIQILQEKYCVSPHGQIKGYGKKKLP